MYAERFTWRGVEDAAEVGVPRAGVYAADSFDQHRMRWCGACYLVAAVQMVEDRLHIARVRRARKDVPRQRASLQTVMDEFQRYYPVRRAQDGGAPGWNVCHGGFAEDVLALLRDQGLPLEVAPEAVWLGMAQRDDRAPPPPRLHPRLGPTRYLREKEVRTQLVEEGPLLLEIASRTLKRTDEDGVVRADAPVGSPDHVVCVVGWTLRDGRAHWVVRNSWAGAFVPRAAPVDDACVRVGRNVCEVDFEPWASLPSDPGFVLLPADHPSVRDASPSPWIACSVTPP